MQLPRRADVVNLEQRYALELEALAPVADIVEAASPNAEAFVEGAADCDAVITSWGIRLDEAIVDRLEQCVVIGLGSVGVDMVDVAAAARAGIVVTNTCRARERQGAVAHELRQPHRASEDSVGTLAALSHEPRTEPMKPVRNASGRLAAIAIAAGTAVAASAGDIDDKLRAALAADLRTDAETARDANRKPLETLKFFGLQDDMVVLELVPGGGWYTKLLAPVLAENGRLAVAIGTQGAATVIAEQGWEAEVIESGDFSRVEGSPLFEITGLDFGSEQFDMVLTFRNLHNFNDAGRAAINEAAFRALKSGGRYGVVDHTRRHMQADTYENWRRMDPVLAIREIEAAGFDFVDYSSLHYRPDDELRYEVGRKTVAGNTDRFTLLFRKP